MSPSVEPFNEAKYKALMDGLECSETWISSAKDATDYFRLEAEYYTAKTIKYQKSIKGKDIISEIQYGTSKYCDEDPHGYPVLRLNELNNGFIETPQKFCHIMSNEEFESLRLHKGDVIIIRTNGNPNLVGQSAVILEETNIAFASYLYRVVPNKKINSETLVSYLNCKYGRNEIDKNSMKGNQTNFSPAKFRDIVIPNFGNAFQDEIRHATEDAYLLRKTADRLYEMASQVITSYFRLDNPPTSTITTKQLSKSYLNTCRLDAEYYQPKYESYAKSLHTEDTVFSLCHIYDDHFLPHAKEKYRYIELANVGTQGNVSDLELQNGDALPSRARRRVKAGQVIVSSIEGSLQNCALITDELDGAICSTGFYVVDSDKINSETLLVLFKSEPIQALMKQRCSGTILTAISKSEFLSMPLPKIDAAIQKDIAQKVQQSFALRRRAEKLIDIAVKAVEIAIEENESAAIDWLKKQVGETSLKDK